MQEDAAEESAKALFQMMEAYPRFKELGADPLHTPGERGALLLRGPLKLLQTVSKVTCAGSGADVASRFRVLLSRIKCDCHLDIVYLRVCSLSSPEDRLKNLIKNY